MKETITSSKSHNVSLDKYAHIGNHFDPGIASLVDADLNYFGDLFSGPSAAVLFTAVWCGLNE